MNVLVTGGAGYIGAVVCERLLADGHRVRVLDKLFWGVEPLGGILSQIELVGGDIRSVADATLDGVDAVVHLAGLSNDPTAEYNPDANWEMNAVATETLASACKRRGVKRFSFGSSASVYDGMGADVMDENAELAPLGAYSKAKFVAERSLLRLADADFEPVILRQATVYGYSPRLRLDLVVNTFTKDALLHGVLYLHGGGRMWRPLVAVEDVARAHLLALQAPAELVAGQIFNVVHANLQIRNLAELVAHAHSLRKHHVRLEDAPLPKLVRDYRCSNEKLARVLGFTPGSTVSEAIAELLVRLPPDLQNPYYYNINWMTALESRFGPAIWDLSTRSTVSSSVEATPLRVLP